MVTKHLHLGPWRRKKKQNKTKQNKTKQNKNISILFVKTLLPLFP